MFSTFKKSVALRGAAVLTALVVTVVSAPSAQAAEATAPAVPPFSDVPASSQFYADVNWMATAGITSGYADGTFRPLKTVDRQTMATFLYRLVNPGQTAPTCTVAPYSDVPITSAFCGAIKWAADEGIVLGYSDRTFRPSAAVSREITALFLARAGNATPLFCVSPPFVDVPANYPYCSTIRWAADNRIVTGWADGTFRGKELVNRQAMAAFFHRFSQL